VTVVPSDEHSSIGIIFRHYWSEKYCVLPGLLLVGLRTREVSMQCTHRAGITCARISTRLRIHASLVRGSVASEVARFFLELEVNCSILAEIPICREATANGEHSTTPSNA